MRDATEFAEELGKLRDGEAGRLPSGSDAWVALLSPRRREPTDCGLELVSPVLVVPKQPEARAAGGEQNDVAAGRARLETMIFWRGSGPALGVAFSLPGEPAPCVWRLRLYQGDVSKVAEGRRAGRGEEDWPEMLLASELGPVSGSGR